MPKLRVNTVTISLDGFIAGPGQSLADPLGAGGEALHEWMFATRTVAGEGGTTGLDDDVVVAGQQNLGATIMGRNMFGPVRGEWPDESWTGWWGDEPPYRHPVFVLTHHERPSVTMRGGTVFHFVTDGVERALELAFDAADGKDVRLAGGGSTIRQCLRAGLVDEMHLVVAPILLGSGERPLDGVTGYRCTRFAASDAALHTWYERA